MATKTVRSGGSNPWPLIKPKGGGGEVFPWSQAGYVAHAKTSAAWHAWINQMPPGPKSIHVVGDILVSNPGVEAILTMRQPQGINPDILMLDLSLVQKPGVWPQVVTNAQARFDRVLLQSEPAYTSVDIFLGPEKIITIDHIDIVS